jgi:lipoyl(octanoyl) transferase
LPRRAEDALVVVWRPGEDGPEFLVLERSPELQGYWHLVAGALEPDESGEEAAARELLEETGLAVPVEDLGFRFSYPTTEESAERRAALGLDVTEVAVATFVAQAPSSWEPVLDPEHVGHRWVTAEEAVALLRYPEPAEAVRLVEERL